MSWKDTIRDESEEEVQQATSWRDSIRDEVSGAESLARGAGQGATLGWSDELLAGARTMYDDVKSVFTGDPANPNAPKPIRDEHGRVINGDQLVGNYDQFLEEERQKNRDAQESNPNLYTTGEVGGSIATAFVPGLNIAKGASAANVIGKAALGGGLSGAGLSEAHNIQDLAMDTATGTVLGAGTAGLMTAGGRALQSNVAKKLGARISQTAAAPLRKAEELGIKGAKKIYKVATDLTDDQMDMILNNPDDVANALDEVGLADQAIKQVRKLEEFIGQADSDAWSTLATSKSVRQGALPKNLIKGRINELKSKLTIKGPSQKTALRNLEVFEEALDELKGQNLSQREVKSFIQALDDNIDWDKQSLKTSNDMLKALRTELDQVLKTSNKMYQEAMEPVSKMTNTLEKVKSALRLKKEAGQGLVPTDTTVSKFKFLPKDSRPYSQDTIKDLDKFVDGDLLHQAEVSAVNRATQGGVANGSRNTLQGAVTGAAAGYRMGGVTGGFTGAVAGGTAGYLKDKMGRKVGKDVLLKGQEMLAPERISKMGKYAKPLMEAASRGNRALSATHFLLMQKDSQYREQLRKAEEDE
jgi:hypothetical protein